MKKIKYFVAALVAVVALIMIIDSANSSPEKVTDIIKHWSIAWAKVVGIIIIVIAIIFVINKILKSEKVMSLVGMLIMPLLIPALLLLCFDFMLWLAVCGFLAGIIIGYFSYIIDDHLLEVWKVRHIVLPLLFGLGLSGSSIVAALAENWQDEYMYVQDYATCHELNLQRYTAHLVKTGKTYTTTYTWDTYRTLYFFKRGEQFAGIREGFDYVLGSGAFGKEDRAVFSRHKWIGGEKLKKSGETMGFKWIYLTDIELHYQQNVVSEVEENFFGQALKDGKLKEIDIPEEPAVQHDLPTSDEIPEMFFMSFGFFKIMFTNPDFSLLRWIYISIYAIFITLAGFSVEWRIGLFIFFVSSTVIILIILAMIAARSDTDLEDLVPRFMGGGGDFGGAGSSGRW